MRILATTLMLLVLPQLAVNDKSFLDMSENERRAWIIDQASEYELWTPGGTEPMKREPPVLRFNDNVSGVVDAILFGMNTGLDVTGYGSVKTGSDFLLQRWVGNQVACNLFQ